MKKFTCKEIMNNEGGCDMEFSGETPMDVATQCSKHVASSTDEAHKQMREMMLNPIIHKRTAKSGSSGSRQSGIKRKKHN